MMILWFRILIFVCVILISNGLAIPKTEEAVKRIIKKSFSSEDHYIDDDHNEDYDHDAFLGEEQAKTFDDLSPEESKERLAKIVDKIDANKDGFVSMDELTRWIQYTQRRYILSDAERQWRGLIDANDGQITWDHFQEVTYGYVEERNQNPHYKEMVERDARRWKKADNNSDGALTKDEFTDFVHPEETAHMKDIVVMETMEDIDKDKDGKLSIDEYMGDMLSEGDNDLEEEPGWLQSEREQFEQFHDKDKSGYMEFEEVKNWIFPADYDNSDAEAKHLIYESDVNRDNQLTKEEILSKFELFVGSQATDFGAALERHDEF